MEVYMGLQDGLIHVYRGIQTICVSHSSRGLDQSIILIHKGMSEESILIEGFQDSPRGGC